MWIRDRRLAAVGLGTVMLLAIGLVAVTWNGWPGNGGSGPTESPPAVGGISAFGGLPNPTSPGSTPGPPPPTSGPGGQPSRPAPGATTRPRSYPTTADGYALATLAAWTARDDARLGDLATPGAITLMGRAPSGLGGGWEFYGCWVEPLSPCRQLRNDRGDVFSVSVDPARLGRAKAVSAAYRDVTRYESTVLSYLHRAIDAWGAGNAERVALLVQGHEAVWFFANIRRQGGHTAFHDYVEYPSALDPANRTCVQALTGDGTSWTWAIDRRLLGRAHALVWAGGEQVC
jgi:hypothetical protein